VRPEISTGLVEWDPFLVAGTPLEVVAEFGTLRWIELEMLPGHAEKALSGRGFSSRIGIRLALGAA
jgi:hypothetical protein